MSNLPFFPVDILRDNMLKYFEMNEQPEAFDYAFKNGLKSEIKFLNSCSIINVVAELIEGFNDDKGIHEKDARFHQIVINNNFCQFYWALIYSYSISLFSTATDSEIILEEKEKKTAYDLFQLAMKMTKEEITPNDFFKYPNPYFKLEDEGKNEKSFIIMANDIYTFGMCFILAHEYAHFDLKHQVSTPSNEYEADNSAFCYMKGYDNDIINYEHVLVGSLSALCALMFLDNTMNGGKNHPDDDDRIVKMVENFNLDENHEVWQIPLFFLRMWSWYYELDIAIFEENLDKSISDKEYYIRLCNKIKHQ